MENDRPMRICRLEAANVKRIKAVEVTPEGHMVVIGGNNGEGKSSVLDSIMYALGGKGRHCEKPLRDGADHGHTVLDLGDLLVSRTYTAGGGGQLVVTNKDGASYKSPQKMLDALVGAISFDPLEFIQEGPQLQVATLQGLLGPEFMESLKRLDAHIQTTFQDRAHLNRQIKEFGIPEEVEPCEAMSLNDVLREKDDLETFNRQQAAAQAVLDQARNRVSSTAARIQELQLEMDRAVQEHKAAEERLGKVPMPEPFKSLDEVEGKLATLEENNAQAQRYLEYLARVDQLEDLKEKARREDEMIKGLRQDRLDIFAGAEFPIEGLEFGDGQVLYNGLPLDQASSAEQLRVSVAMGLAMNPKLRVVLVRDGSLLDQNSLKLVAEMAEASDAQVWVERVGEGDECQVIIEDGQIKAGAGG